MKYLFLIISLFLLSSCTIDWNNEKNIRIIELEKQIQSLKIENANLQEENSVVKAGGVPSQIQVTPSSGGSTIMNNSLFPEGTTFEEMNGVDCIRKANNNYITAGIKKCKSLGYSDTEIKGDKCQLDTSFIQSLQKKKTDEEATCGPQ